MNLKKYCKKKTIIRRWLDVATCAQITLYLFYPATSFAEEMGFTVEDIRTEKTKANYTEWLEGDCQPDNRKVFIYYKIL